MLAGTGSEPVASLTVGAAFGEIAVAFVFIAFLKRFGPADNVSVVCGPLKI
jgi:hypothetical protein